MTATRKSGDSFSASVLEALKATGASRNQDYSSLQIVPVHSKNEHRSAMRCMRFNVFQRGGEPLASVKRIPRTPLYQAEAIVAAYAAYERANAFRPVRLLGHCMRDGALWLVEEFLPEITTLDDLVGAGQMTNDEATRIIVTIIDDIWDLHETSPAGDAQSTLASVRKNIANSLTDTAIANAITSAWEEMLREHPECSRSVLSTRDYIGRNILRGSDGLWTLIDFDLAHRTPLFFIDAARTALHMPYCTDLLYTARCFRGLDRALVDVVATAIEQSLQCEFASPKMRPLIQAEYRRRAVAMMAPPESRGEFAAVHDLQERLKQSEFARHEMTRNHAELTQKWESQIKHLESRIAESTLRVLNSNGNAATSHRRGAVSQVDQLKLALAHVEARLEQSLSIREHIEREHATLTTAWERHIKGLEARIADLEKNTLPAARARIVELERESAMLAERARGLESDATRLHAARDALTKEWERHIHALEERLRDLSERALPAERARASELEQSLMIANERLHRADDLLERRTREHAEAITSWRTRTDDLSTRLETSLSALGDLEARCEAERRRADGAESVSIAQTARANHAQSTLLQLQAQQEQLEKKAQSAEVEMRSTAAAFRAAAEAREREISQMREYVARLQGTFAWRALSTLGLARRHSPTQSSGRVGVRRQARESYAGLRVLIVADRVDAPFRYRCAHAREQLRADGVHCDVLNIHDERIERRMELYSVVILSRLPWSPRVERVIAAARARDCAVSFDVDDLVFDPGQTANMPFLKTAPAWLRLRYEANARKLQQTLRACDSVIASTPAIKLAAERMGIRGTVHPNLLGAELISIGRRVCRFTPVLQRRPLMVYMSGSATHCEDLASIAPALCKVLSSNPNALLMLVGFLELAPALHRHARQIIRLPFMDWRVQPWATRMARVNLAPLAELNDFTNAKSALKFFEAGAAGVPTIASPSEPFRHAIDSGQNGVLAGNNDEWHDAMVSLLSEAHSRQMGDAARASAIARHSHVGHRRRLADIMASLGGPRRDNAPDSIQLPEMDRFSARTLTRQERSSDRARRVRFVLGLMRRAGRPLTLHRPDLCRLNSVQFNDVLVDPANAMPADDQRSRSSAHGMSHGDLRGGTELWNGGAGWTMGSGVVAADQSGESAWLTSSDHDPWLATSRHACPTRDFQTILIAMAAAADADDVVGQVFWATDNDAGFCESRSMRFPVIADGAPHTYVLDITAHPWPRQSGLTLHLRVDPLNTVGRFQITSIQLSHQRLTAFTTTQAPVDDTPSTRQPVDIVVPIYNAFDDLRKCVDSVLRHAAGDWRLVLVNDASTDARVRPYLEGVARQCDRVCLLENERNLGFVGTANHGMRHSGGRDVLLLNSDTIVTADFIGKLARCAHSGPAAGIACPFTNNGTVCSIPEWLKDNALPDGMSLDEYAQMISALSCRRYPHLVTAVGFCMYIRSDVLRAVGLFDELNFGRGFGEENDFTERAKSAGFTARLCDDLFVAHMGKCSFGQEGHELERLNSRVLDQLHPRYHADVAEFCRADPLADLHEQVRFHLRRQPARRYPAMLFVSHASTFAQNCGGTEHHIRDLVEQMRLPRAVIVYPIQDAIIAAEVIDGDLAAARRFRFACSGLPRTFSQEDSVVDAALDRIITLFDVRAAHLHHLLTWPVSSWRALHRRGVPFAYTLHDYYAVCPSFNLMNHTTCRTCACGGQPHDDVTQCISSRFGSMGIQPPADASAHLVSHRDEFREMLNHASLILAPSSAAKELTAATHGTIADRIIVAPHGHALKASASSGTVSTEPLRVALIGQVAYETKGAAEYKSLVAMAAADDVEWHVFGDVDVHGFRQALVRAAPEGRLRLHGPYARDQIVELLAANRVDVAVILSPWHETFCYTLSESWLAGIPVIVSNFGALAQRVRESGAGQVVADVAEARQLLAKFARDRSSLDPMRQAARRVSLMTLAEHATQQRGLYGDLHELVTARQEHRAYDGLDVELSNALLPANTAALAAVERTRKLPYQSSFWYPLYARFKQSVPAKWRAGARATVLRYLYSDAR